MRIVILFVLVTQFVFSQIELNPETMFDNSISELSNRYIQKELKIKYDTLYEPRRFKFTNEDIYYTIFFSGKICYRVIVTPEQPYKINDVYNVLKLEYIKSGIDTWSKSNINVRVSYPTGRSRDTLHGMFFEWVKKR